jgi:hypothetical protein
MDMPSVDIGSFTTVDLNKKRKMPPLIVSHSQKISKRMESKAKTVSSKYISQKKLDKIITNAYEYEQQLPDKKISELLHD